MATHLGSQIRYIFRTNETCSFILQRTCQNWFQFHFKSYQLAVLIDVNICSTLFLCSKSKNHFWIVFAAFANMHTKSDMSKTLSLAMLNKQRFFISTKSNDQIKYLKGRKWKIPKGKSQILINTSAPHSPNGVFNLEVDA